MGLLDRHVAFVAALREAGLRVSTAESLDALAAARTVDLLDRDRFRTALASSLVKRQVQRETFDATFELFYPPLLDAGTDSTDSPDSSVAPGAPVARSPQAPGTGDPARDDLRARLSDVLAAGGDERQLDAIARDAVTAFGAVAGRRPGQPSWSRLAVLSRVSPDTLMAGVLARVLRGGDRGGLAERTARTMITARIAQFELRVGADVARRLAEQGNPATVARSAVRPSIDEVAFLGATRADLARMRREVQPLARRLATRLALEQRRGTRGAVDFRRTVRAAISTGGVPAVVEHRPKRPARTDLVVLCDLSESVTAFAHFTLLLVYALREQFGRVRAFGFVDELDELTRFFRPGGDVLDAVTRLTAEADVTGLLGRTDYGRAFELFAHRFPEVVGPRTALLILGDARSNYGPVGVPALTALAGKARHAYWLNPERRALWDSGDSRASDVAAVVPMTECRNLAQLAAFVRELAPVRR